MHIVNNTGKNNVLVLKVDEEDVNTILLNTDLDEKSGRLRYVYENFADIFSQTIPEYAFAYHDPLGKDTNYVQKLREAAKSIMKLPNMEKLRNYFSNNIPETDWDPEVLNFYRGKGVLGEIILHMILKEFKKTIPLVSKVYFKDSFSQEAKGFDIVHVSEDGTTLWLGETKFYTQWKKGVDALIDDLKNHLKKDYLEEQFVIIKRGLETEYTHPKREEWIEKLNKPVVLKDVFQYVKIPLLCIYEDDIATDYLKAIDEAIKDSQIEKHTETVLNHFNKKNLHTLKAQLQTILILMPVEAKNKLIKYMLEKLWHMQNI